jgi:hypothetical protein
MNMRISQSLYLELRKVVEPHMPKEGMNSERARWDALRASGFDTHWLYKEVLNDAHIDTALKKIATFKGDNG